MPDDIFAEPRLVQVYDAVEGDRDDLDHYLAIAAELGASSVLDVGCGTGTFACLLARHGYAVTGAEPSAAMLAAARAKPGAEQVRWVHGDAASLPGTRADLATMTGNTAQVFLTDQDWAAALTSVRAALRPGGHLPVAGRDRAVAPGRRLHAARRPGSPGPAGPGDGFHRPHLTNATRKPVYQTDLRFHPSSPVTPPDRARGAAWR